MNYTDNETYLQLREKIIHKLKKVQRDKRHDHTLRVEETAKALAKIHNVNVQKASIAALLHDYAKNYSKEKKLSLCNKYKIHLSLPEEENIELVHGKIAGYIAQDKFDIHDLDIIAAITYHTTGRPGMSPLEKVIYVADFIEPGRKEFPGLIKARELAYEDLDRGIIKISMLTINHIIDQGGLIDPVTERTYEYYYGIYAKKHHKQEKRNI